MTVRIVFDNDRDGWGSAALVVSNSGLDASQLHPLDKKDRRTLNSVLQEIEWITGDELWVLDIPKPSQSLDWDGATIARSIWVDHHAHSWSDTKSVDGFRLEIERSTDVRTTTMRMLFDRGLVDVPNGMSFVRKCCTDDDLWGIVFDCLSAEHPDYTVDGPTLARAIAVGLRGHDVPDELQQLYEQGLRRRQDRERVFKKLPREETEDAVVITIPADSAITPRYCSLLVRSNYRGRFAIVAYRGGIYCGSPEERKFDLMEHFANRGWKPVGHSYVCFVRMPSTLIQDEVKALLVSIGGKVAVVPKKRDK